jgi:hypothetical protein
MYSLSMLPLVIANTLLVVWLVRSWTRNRDWLLLVTLIPMIALPYDTGIVALGSTIGQGDLLRMLSAPRLNWFYLTAPLLLIITGGLARRADFAWAQSNGLMVGLGALALGFVVYDAPRIFQIPTLYPACFEDVVRYVSSVKPAQACTPGQAGIDVGGSVPWAGLAGMLLLLVLGVLLWWKRGWPWLVLGSVTSAILLGLPNTPIGPLTTFYGDFLSLGAIVWTTIHFSSLQAMEAMVPDTIASKTVPD